MSDQTMTLEEAPADGKRGGWLRVAGAVVVLVVLYLVGRELGGYLPRFARWVDGLGVWGPLVFIVGYAAATVALIPGSLLTLSAGAIFGIAEGIVYVFIGASLGATGGFLVARYLARSWVERRMAGSAKFAAMDRAVRGEGLKIVTLLRLSPVFPFNLLNYGLGLTDVRLRDYVLACFGMLPGTFLYVYYGKLAGDVAAVAAGAGPERGSGYWAVLGIGLVATVLVTTVVTRAARRALREATDA